MGRPSRRRTIGFDAIGFADAIKAEAKKRGTTLQQISRETGVGPDTIWKMRSRGSAPDGVSMAALCKWSGINPGQFSTDALVWSDEDVLRRPDRASRVGYRSRKVDR